MPSRPGRTTDEISAGVRTLVDRVLEADVTETIAERGRELATAVGEATELAAERAGEAWKESAPTRREALKTMRRASRDAAKWSDRTWRKELRPTLKDLWGRRTVALGMAGAAVPAGRELAETAAERLGIRKREERHWGTFFIGLLVGVAAGIAAALLLAPKTGREMRDELSERAQGAAERARQAADAAADKARTVARDTDWAPLFQRKEGNGTPAAEAVAPAAEPAIERPPRRTRAKPVEPVEAPSETVPSPTDEMTEAVAQEVEEEREGI